MSRQSQSLERKRYNKATNSCLEMLRLRILLIGSVLISSSRCEKGSCPPSIPVDLCEAACGPSSPCSNSSQLCCPTACGGAMCVDPMTKRHFVDLVKEGRCPEHPRGPWVCSDTCTGDSDCPRTLKCCPNRCGALTCQRPDAAVETVGRSYNLY